VLIRSNLTYLNLTQSQGSYGYTHPRSTLVSVQSLQVTTNQCQTVVVVCGVGKFIMARGQRVVVKFSQDSLDALRAALLAHAERLNSFLEPSWPNTEKVHEEMYNMVDTLMIHAVDQKWLSAFAKIGSTEELVTSQEIRAVSWSGLFCNFCNTSN
jgi:hypothetical protein